MTDGDITEKLSSCYTGVVHDVLRSMGESDLTLPSRLRSTLPAASLAGPVWTYSGRHDPDMDDHATLLAWTGMLSKAPPGHVIVCQPNDATVAHLGELSAEALKLRGVLGAVIDGGCRDVAFLNRMGFPVFCSYYTPRDIVGNWAPVAFEEPIQIASTTISTGDFLVGDLDGVQIVPRRFAAEVADRALTVVNTESEIRSAILDGMDPQSAYLRYGKVLKPRNAAANARGEPDMTTVDVVSRPVTTVGESPYWNPATEELSWVDIPSGRVYRHHLASGSEDTIDVPQPIGAAVPRATGGFVGAVRDGIAVFDERHFRVVVPIEMDRPGNQMNDAKADPRGRLWAGTMDTGRSASVAALYRVNVDLAAVPMLQSVTQSNGLGWSPDHRSMYYIDTATHRVDVFDFEPDSGVIANRQVLASLESMPQFDPDGLAVDADGGIWVALFGAGRIVRFSPDGSEERSVELPVSQVTSAAFGGSGLRTLFVTTASLGYEPKDFDTEPLAGSVFAIDVGVAGMPVDLFGG